MVQSLVWLFLALGQGFDYNGRVLAYVYPIDNSGSLGSIFDGIGGLSGGGATSKLLINYVEPYRSQILDYLFKPNFAASLQILKVEIGGDSQSTDGTESSHMHEVDDENYSRGYEWWLMYEAKKRNPNIKLYGLPWAFPNWISRGTGNPYAYPNITAFYIAKWIVNAKKVYDLDIDYIGIWNERNYNATYIKILRQYLDMYSLQNLKIVANDNGWDIAKDIQKDPELAKAVDIIGAHYPGTLSSVDALKTNKTLWSSEDYSTFNDNTGGGCWARLLNQNYVNGHMTSTISWNLIASYYDALPYTRNGLMTANEPWSGYYSVESPIWITAHTTQFTNPGWIYLSHGKGVDKLQNGGSFVTLTDPFQNEMTLIIETMSHDHSICIRPPLKPYTVKSQDATFNLYGNFRNIKILNMWVSHLGFGGNKTTLFEKKRPLEVINGSFTIHLDVDVVITLTTLNIGIKGQYPPSPGSSSFPVPYFDDFESYPEFSEPFNFAPQAGVFEVRQTNDPNHRQVMEQIVLHHPIDWCGVMTQPIGVIGNYLWASINVTIDFFVEEKNGTKGVCVAAHVKDGGCSAALTPGVFLWIFVYNKTFMLSQDLLHTKILITGNIPSVDYNQWHTLTLAAMDEHSSGYLDNQELFKDFSITSGPINGFVAIATDNFGLASFDNLYLTNIRY